MQFPDLFKVIADYVGFVVDFLAFRGLRDYALKPAVDPVLAAYFVVGVLFAYLLSTARRFPGYEKHLEAGTPKRAPSGTTTAPLKEHSSDMALFIMASMLGAVVVHWLFVLGNAVLGGDEFGSVKATLNATLAWNAVFHPLNAFAKKCSVLLQAAREKGSVRPRVAGTLGGVLVLVPLALVTQWIHAMATVHGTSFWYMAAVQGVSFVALVVLLVAIGSILLKDDDEETDDRPVSA